MARKLVTDEMLRIQRKYNEIYPESMEMLKTMERVNLIDAYYKGAMDAISKMVDIDNYLKTYDNESEKLSN